MSDDNDSALSGIKKLARKAGHFGELVRMFGRLWRENPADFERVLAQSWLRSEFIPMVPVVLMSEKDDAKMREAVRRVVTPQRMQHEQKAFLFLAPALWGDEWAKEYLVEDLNERLQRAIQSDSPKLLDLAWSLKRAAMISHWGNRADLEKLRQRFERKELYEDECLGMVEALLDVQENGFASLAQRLGHSLAKRKILAADVAACFVLGAARDREHMPLFLRIHRELAGWNFWRTGLRRRALASFAYGTLPGEAVQQVIEEWLVRERRKLMSWWFGGDRTSEFMNACDILWNVEEPLSSGIVSVLQTVAVGSNTKNAKEATAVPRRLTTPWAWRASNKENAKEAIALLSLKGLEVPHHAIFDPESIDIKWSKDFMQYDKGLNFAYYWRCRPKSATEAQIT